MYKIDWSKYLVHDRCRKSTRIIHDEDARNEYESDFGRVIFSSAIRRMHDKAQVMPLTSGDSMHTRLTHSLEVMSIAYSLGINLCRDKDFIETYDRDYARSLEQQIPIILKTSSLVHDIGNPPFGHFGEAIIQKYFTEYFTKNKDIIDKDKQVDFTQFDGNAQGLRILSKLQYIGDLYGLNLTFAVLGAYIKYPNIKVKDKTYIGTKKHGVFTSERFVFNSLVRYCSLESENGKIKRHPLCFLVEAADSICYNIMDVEDGLNKGWYTYDTIIDFLQAYIKKQNNDEKFDLKNRLGILDGIDGAIKSPKRKMVDLRIKIIQYLVQHAIVKYKEKLEDIDKGNYTLELIEDEDPIFLSKALQAFAKQFIYTRKEIQNLELTGITVVRGLLDYLIEYVFTTDEDVIKRAKSILSKTCINLVRHEMEYNKDKIGDIYFYDENEYYKYDLRDLDNYSKLRMIVDFISGMTDKYALNLYRQLSGQKLL